MISKGISEEDIEEFLNELKDIKLIDDKKFIENFLDLRIDTTGILKLIQGLEKFGILEETARAYLSEYRERELKGLKRILESSLENCEDKKEIKKLIEVEGITSFKTFMAYKGALMIDDRQIWSEDSDFKMDFTSSIYDSEP